MEEKQEKIQEVLKLYEEGMTVEKISRKFKTSNVTIYQILKQYATQEIREQHRVMAVKNLGAPRKNISKEEVIEEFKKGLSYTKIANKYGVSTTLIRARVKEYENDNGIKLEDILLECNIEMNNNKKKEYPIDEAIRRLEKGEPIEKIAIEYGVSKSTIYKDKRINEEQNGIFNQKYIKRKKDIPMEEVIEALKNKETIANIAKKYNVVLTTLKQRIKQYERQNGISIKEILQKENVHLKTRKRDDISMEQLIEEIKNGCSYTELAKKYNVSVSTISGRKKEYEERTGEKINRMKKLSELKVKDIKEKKEKKVQKTEKNKQKKISIGNLWNQYTKGITISELSYRYNIDKNRLKTNLHNYQSLLFAKLYVDKNKTVNYIANQAGCPIGEVTERIKKVLQKEVTNIPADRYLKYRIQGLKQIEILKILLLEKRKKEKETKKSEIEER